MKKLLAILLAAFALLSLCACQKTCKYDGCDRTPVEGGEYCEKHTCQYPGCLEYGIMWWYDTAHYCQEHWGQVNDEACESENPNQALKISCKIAADGIASWTVENTGKCTYKHVEIQLIYKDKYGNQKFTKSVYCDNLKPGGHDGSSYVLMYCETSGTLSARIVDYEKAN